MTIRFGRFDYRRKTCLHFFGLFRALELNMTAHMRALPIPPCSTRNSKVELVISGNPDLAYWLFTTVGGFIVNSIFN